MKKRSLVPLLVLACVGFGLVPSAARGVIDEINKSPARGVAIKGYDPVSYLEDGRAIQGSKKITFEWREATWRFASKEHRDLFAGDPERYAPQYGGYCARAMALGSNEGIDPYAWQVVDGRLYLFASRDHREAWREDIPASIEAGDRNWPVVRDLR